MAELRLSQRNILNPAVEEVGWTSRPLIFDIDIEIEIRIKKGKEEEIIRLSRVHGLVMRLTRSIRGVNTVIYMAKRDVYMRPKQGGLMGISKCQGVSVFRAVFSSGQAAVGPDGRLARPQQRARGHAASWPGPSRRCP